MFVIGLLLFAAGVVISAIFMPAAHSAAHDDPSEWPRVLQNSKNIYLYLWADFVLRWGGSALIVISLFGYENTWWNIIFGGITLGFLAMWVSTGIALYLACKIYPWFKNTLEKHNSR